MHISTLTRLIGKTNSVYELRNLSFWVTTRTISYHLWDSDKQKVVISWDIVFDKSGILMSDYTPLNDNKVE